MQQGISTSRLLRMATDRDLGASVSAEGAGLIVSIRLLRRWFGRRVIRLIRTSGAAVGRRINRKRRPLYRSSLFDDFIMAQPLNLIPRWERRRGIHRDQLGDESYVSVVIVSYNTLSALKSVVEVTRRLSPTDTEIVVVDNGSSDGSKEWLAGQPYGIIPILLRTNLGHGRGLDIGIYRSTGSIFVTLDSDAFPVRADWIQTLVAKLNEGFVAVGWRGARDRLHPALAAMRRADFFKLNLSFAGFQLEPSDNNFEFGVNCWDTGELISEAIGKKNLYLFDFLETEFGGQLVPKLAYHHCGLTTLSTDPNDARAGTGHDQSWTTAIEYFNQN